MVLAPVFDYIDQEAGEKLLKMVQVTDLFHTEFIFVRRRNRSSGAKTGLLRRAGAKT